MSADYYPFVVGVRVYFNSDMDQRHFSAAVQVRRGRVASVREGSEPRYLVRLDDGRVVAAYVGEVGLDWPQDEEGIRAIRAANFPEPRP